MSINGVVGLDFQAITTFAGLGGLSADAAALLSMCLPEVEAMAVKGLRKGSDE